MTLTRFAAPALNEKGLRRVFSFAHPKRMTPESTQFDTGYEQAKRDLLEILSTEVGKTTVEAAAHTAIDEALPNATPAETRARRRELKASEKRWWW